LNFLIEAENFESSFRVFVTSLRLLSLLRLSQVVMTDATYKLIWQGYPCIVVGVVDHNKSFHPIGFIVCDSEDYQNFEFVFSSIRNFDPNFKPRFLVADCADAITKGFELGMNLSASEYIRVFCWAHTHRNISDHLKPLKSKTPKLKFCLTFVSYKPCPHSKSLPKQ